MGQNVGRGALGRSCWAWVLLAAIAVSGCALARQSVALRERDDLRPAGSGEWVLPEGDLQAGRAYGIFGADSVVIYRAKRPGRPYVRETRSAARGLTVSGYTRADGTRVSFEGTVRREGDVLVFEPRPARGLAAPVTEQRLPASEVRSVDAWFPSVGKTVLLVTIVGVLALFAWALALASSFSNSAM